MHLHFIQQSRIVKKVDLIDVTCEEYSQEVLRFSDSIAYNNPSPYFDPIVSTSSPTLTPFDESDFLSLKEADAFIAIDDDNFNHDPIYLTHIPGDYSTRKFKKDLKVVEPKKSSVEYATSYEPKDEIPKVELKELPSHLERRKELYDSKIKNRIFMRMMQSCLFPTPIKEFSPKAQVPDGMDQSKITRKQSKNGQARTRKSEEYKAEARKVKPQSKSAKKNQSQSNMVKGALVNSRKLKYNGRVKWVKSRFLIALSQAQAMSSMEKHTRYVGFAINTLTQLAQAVTSKNDSLAIRASSKGLEASPTGYK
ncbi:hypothetical protein Tco_1174114 [Tanacetum coccineum]